MEDLSAADRLRVLYEENGRVAAAFWEWRHKLLTSYFAAVGGIFVLSGWLYGQHFGEITALPLFVGPLISGVAALLDVRNASILKHCYSVGQQIRPGLNYFDFERRN
ncbi:MAG TPA: hypothetical protein VJT15_12115 [Pyrinomonadaceae bacterium]|nr:hypothetical protein [Pyrinomonadaceae bacterium]